MGEIVHLPVPVTVELSATEARQVAAALYLASAVRSHLLRSSPLNVPYAELAGLADRFMQAQAADA